LTIDDLGIDDELRSDNELGIDDELRIDVELGINEELREDSRCELTTYDGKLTAH
jgi:hypothetical protein